MPNNEMPKGVSLPSWTQQLAAARRAAESEAATKAELEQHANSIGARAKGRATKADIAGAIIGATTPPTTDQE